MSDKQDLITGLKKLIASYKAYVEFVNWLDDYLEYRYKADTREEMKDLIMGGIDGVTEELLKIKNAKS